MSLVPDNYSFGSYSLEGNPFFASGSDPKTPTNTAMFEARMGQYQQALDAGMSPDQALTFIGKPETGFGDRDLELVDRLLERSFDPERLKEQLQIKNEFEAERMKQAAPYKLMFNLPKQMMDVAAMELAGAGKYAQIMNQGLQTLPSMKPAAVNTVRTAQKYF